MNVASKFIGIMAIAIIGGIVGFWISTQHAPFLKEPKGTALAGQWLTSDGKGGTYFSGTYKFPISKDIPVSIQPPAFVGLYPQFMARLASRGSGYPVSSSLILPVTGGSGSGMNVEVITDHLGHVTSARIVEMGEGYQNNELVYISGSSSGIANDASISLYPFAYYATPNTPFDIGSVPMTVPRIGGQGASPVGKWLGGDAGFSFQLASEKETGGDDLYYMGFSDSFIGDYEGVPLNTFYGQRGTESYFIHNSFAIYDLNKFKTTEYSEGWLIPFEKDLTDTIQYYWSYTDLYDFDTRPSSSQYATLPSSFYSYAEQPKWKLWPMAGIRVRDESKFIVMAYSNFSTTDLTTVISVDTHGQWHSPYVNGRELQWDIDYFRFPETLAKVNAKVFPDGSGYVAWTTSLVYADGTIGVGGNSDINSNSENDVYMIGQAGVDCVLARGNVSEISKGNFDNVELWIEPGKWVNHKTTSSLIAKPVITSTGGLNTGAGFYFNQTLQRWFTWIIPFSVSGNSQLGTNFIELYQSQGPDITSDYNFYQSVYQIPDPVSGYSALDVMQLFPYNVTVHPQLHTKPDEVLPLVYNVNFGTLSSTGRGGGTMFSRGGDTIYKPIVVGNHFCANQKCLK